MLFPAWTLKWQAWLHEPRIVIRAQPWIFGADEDTDIGGLKK